jgi:hypothetical protein
MTTLAERYKFCKMGAAREGRKPAPLPRNLGKLHDRVPCEHTYSGKVYPSGDFSVGIVPDGKIRRKDQQYECTAQNPIRQVVSWDEGDQSFHEVAYLPSAREPVSPNLVSTLKLSHREKYGQKGITGYGKRMVSSGAVMLQEEWGVERTGFATLTVPPLPLKAMEALTNQWGEVVKRFFEEFRRLQLRIGGDTRYVCVTEIQENRFRKRGEIGLHLHFIYKARHEKRGNRWLVSARWCRDTWRRILANRLDHVCTDIPLPRCELAIVHTSGARYLGKYMSKGVKVCADIKKAMPDVTLPAQWWTLPNNLRRDIKARIIRLDSISAYTLWKAASADPPIPEIFFARRVEISSEVFGVRSVGILGRLDFNWFKNYYEGIDSPRDT